MTGPFVDAQGAFKHYLNTLTETLVGTGNPLPHGAHLKPIRSPASGAYVRLLLISSSPMMTAETPVGRARISGMVYGATKEAASLGAIAYANVLASLDGMRTPMRDVVCITTDNIQGPSEIDDHDSNKNQYRFLVDADLFFVNP